MKTSIVAAAAVLLTIMPSPASAQRYLMRTRIPGLKASATATPTPTEYKGVWRNTGEQSAGVCNNGTRRIDWVYECRVNGNVSYSGSDCDPATKPDTLSHTQSCSSTCASLDTPGYVTGTGPGGTQTVSGTLAEMKAQAKTFCEGYSIRPDLERACSLRQDPGNPGQWYMSVASDFPPLTVIASPGAVHSTCQVAP
jgi:hypothetical protein